MSKNIKLVLTDMDDTVAQHGGHDISDAVREAIIAVENQGVTVTPVTGRTYSFAKQALVVLGISGPCVVDGGATIVDAETGDIIWKQWLDAARVRELVEKMMPYCHRILFSPEGHETIAVEDIVLDLIDSDAPSIFAFIDESKEQELKEALADVPDLTKYFFLGSYPITRKRARAVQISDINATKYHGVEALRELQHVPKDQILAIGDGDNDVALFESAGVKVAVGNATDNLKAVADDVVGSIDEDGFVEAMHKYVLL